jgi:hypothetical protein
MVESTADLISSHVATGARLMAREKQIIAELKEKGVDAREAERTLRRSPLALGHLRINGWQSGKKGTRHRHMAEKHPKRPSKSPMSDKEEAQRAGDAWAGNAAFPLSGPGASSSGGANSYNYAILFRNAAREKNARA